MIFIQRPQGHPSPKASRLVLWAHTGPGCRLSPMNFWQVFPLTCGQPVAFIQHEGQGFSLVVLFSSEIPWGQGPTSFLISLKHLSFWPVHSTRLVCLKGQHAFVIRILHPCLSPNSHLLCPGYKTQLSFIPVSKMNQIHRSKMPAPAFRLYLLGASLLCQPTW